jgi:hypothetical protein
MNPRSTFVRKIGYLLAIVVLLVLLFWLGRPATDDAHGAQGTPGGKLAQLRQEYGLSQAQLGEVDPTSEAIKLATLGMRGVAANILWTKANEYKKKKDWTNLSATLNQITKLQPNFISVWKFQAWNLSYNVSAEFDDYRDRYAWVIKGIDFLKRGIRYNEYAPRLHWDVGWFTAQKIGRADERKQFRRLFKADDDYHGSRPVALRDNWLVGQEWFREAERIVDTGLGSMEGMSPLVFRSDAAMCQMNYAEALETDGTFGQVAKRAWMEAARQWNAYGAREIPSAYGVPIHLNDEERLEETLARKQEEFEAIAPEVREQIEAERRAALTEDQKEALEVPKQDRTPKQYDAARIAERTLAITYDDVVERLTGPKKAEAEELAEQLKEIEQRLTIIRRYRQIVNFEYWRLRAEVEQNDETLTARKLIYQGDRAFENGDLTTARDLYEKGLAAWRKVLDRFPALLDEGTTGEDLLLVIQRYQQILGQLDEKMPQPFILQDVIDQQFEQNSGG